jgi:hypothetical protein
MIPPLEPHPAEPAGHGQRDPEQPRKAELKAGAAHGGIVANLPCCRLKMIMRVHRNRTYRSTRMRAAKRANTPGWRLRFFDRKITDRKIFLSVIFLSIRQRGISRAGRDSSTSPQSRDRSVAASGPAHRDCATNSAHDARSHSSPLHTPLSQPSSSSRAAARRPISSSN